MTKINNLHLRRLKGTFTKLSTCETIAVQSMTFDELSEQKLLAVLNEKESFKGCKNQNLHIEELLIKAEDVNKFCKGQTSLIYEDNKIVYSSLPNCKKEFKGQMKGRTKISDYIRAVEVNIGCIEFNISGQYERLSSEVVSFQNISATIYPRGEYSIMLIED